jgi:hypothetical protein
MTIMKYSITISGNYQDIPLSGNKANTFHELFNNLRMNHFQVNSNFNSEYLLMLDHNARKYRKFINSGGNSKKAILIRLEPKSVNPAQYRKSMKRKYGLIISPGSVFDFENSKEFIGWPYKYHLDPSKPSTGDPLLSEQLKKLSNSNFCDIEEWQSRKISILLIASNKVGRTHNSNYGIRRSIVKSIPPDILQTYGPMWNSRLWPRLKYRIGVILDSIKIGSVPNFYSIAEGLLSNFPQTHGVVADKHALIRQAKFNLIIENENTYCSEKIFDSLINGSIPIYLGPPLNKVGLPEDLGIQIKSNSSNVSRQIQETLLLSQSVIERYLDSISKFVFSEPFQQNWIETSVWNRVSRQILLYVKSLS